MPEDHVFDLLPGYTLDSLDEDELRQVTRHLPNCATCQKELSSYQDMVSQMTAVLPGQNPPPALKGKVLRRVTGVLEDETPARPNLLDMLRALMRGQAGLVFGGIALLLVIILGVNNFLLWRQMNDIRAHLPGENVRIIRMNGTKNAPQAVGYVMVFKDELYGSLTVENAPVLDAKHQYQIWLVKDGKRTSGGVFSVNEEGYGTLQVTSGQPLDTYQSFGITVEPTGGSPGPTGEKVLGGNL
jgi:anti-sigma-K factor RskA